MGLLIFRNLLLELHLIFLHRFKVIEQLRDNTISMKGGTDVIEHGRDTYLLRNSNVTDV